ncbi:Uncharacterized protein Fot_37665 [Forsythia ovata]|uniref:Uncharacterized protein n=1 Tax=Forsythia ovata TaxID=205694 RepID=A0ABD1RZM1_9LAMI
MSSNSSTVACLLSRCTRRLTKEEGESYYDATFSQLRIENWYESLIACHRVVIIYGHMARAMVFIQGQIRKFDISVAQVAKLEDEVTMEQKVVEKLEKDLELAKKNPNG